MKATHRVKDSAGNPVGYIVDEKFYTEEYLKDNIQFIENLSLMEGNISQIPWGCIRSPLHPENDICRRPNLHKPHIHNSCRQTLTALLSSQSAVSLPAVKLYGGNRVSIPPNRF